jgi:hypothetical protein
MSEWRVTEVDMDATEDASNGLSSSLSESSVIGETLTTMTATATLTPPNMLQTGQRSRRRPSGPTAASINLGDRFAPLERFLEAGRQMQLQQQQLLQQQQQQPQQPQVRPNNHLRNKIVFSLTCRYCRSFVCNRAMRAILLADTKVELYSTDIPPSHHTATGDDDRLTHGCHCRIRDTLCRLCGNVLGYHVSQPCERCLMARNNGHFWMFYSEVVEAGERQDRATGKALSWAQLAPMCQEVGDDGVELIGGYEQYSR